MFKIKKLLFIAVSLLLLVAGGTLQAKPTLQDGRFFPETGYGVDNDVIWDYFQSRGAVDTFGYPVSDLFDYRGFDVQIFQRHVLQINGEQARPLNLLDPDVMPINSFGGLTFPQYDSALAASAPAPDAANYGEAVRQHLEANVPEMSQNQPIGFLSYYLSAAPADAGGLRTLLALEVWGFPTSQPKADPNNENFIYQRFQRGIMHYDATNNVTRGILLGDAFKEMIGTGGTEPIDESPEALIGNSQMLYAVEEAGQWALKSWPDETLLSDPIFDRFYGEYANITSGSLGNLNNQNPKLSPNGRYLLLPGVSKKLHPTVPDEQVSTGLWLIDLVERTSRQLLPEAQIATWNPSSEQITYVEEDTLYTLNIFSEEPVPLFEHPDLLNLFAEWSPDGKWIAVTTLSPDSGTPQTYWAIPTNGDAPREIVTIRHRNTEFDTGWLQWSPDSQYLLLRWHGMVYNLAGDRLFAGRPESWVPNKTQSTVLIAESDRSEFITIEGREITNVGSGWARNTAFSKDGKRLAYFVEDANQVLLKVFELGANRNIDVAPLTTGIRDLRDLFWNAESRSLIYQQSVFNSNTSDDSIWMVPAKPNQSPIELFSPGVLIDVVPMPDR